MDEINLDSWHESLEAAMTARVTELGKYPHRANGTVHAMNLRSLGKVMELAKLGQKMQKKHAKNLKAVVADELRKLADQVENESE